MSAIECSVGVYLLNSEGELILVAGISSAATGASSGRRTQGCCGEKSAPETLTTACHAASWLARS